MCKGFHPAALDLRIITPPPQSDCSTTRFMQEEPIRKAKTPK